MALNLGHSAMEIESFDLHDKSAWTSNGSIRTSLTTEANGIAARSRSREILLTTVKHELDELRTFAWIFVAEDGGPIRTIIDGRHKTETGRNTFVKSGSRGMPWESRAGEEPLMRLCEVATPVHSYLAQPHRLEMAVSGHGRHLVYFPDAELKVDRAFAEALMKKGARFDEAVRKFRPENATGDQVTLVIEAKTEGDTRRFEPMYQAKLTLAKQVYSGLGWYFYEVLNTRDLANAGLRRVVNDIYFSRYTAIDRADIAVALDVTHAPRPTYRRLLDELGGGKVAAAKAAALHIRRVISLNLSTYPRRQANVRSLGDHQHLLAGVI